MKSIFTSEFAGLALPALTVTLGMQMLRALPPYLQYLLGDRLGWNSIQMGLVALVVFAGSFLVGRLNQLLGLRRLLLLTAGGVGLLRLVIQAWPGDPVVDMLLVLPAVTLFLLSLAAFLLAACRQQNPLEAAHRLGLAILLGLVLDTALHGLFLTYDFIWQSGLLPLALTLGLVILQWLYLRTVLPDTPRHPAPYAGRWTAILPWLALGPLLFLQLLIFQNQARLATLTGWPLPAVAGWALVAHLLGLTVAARRPGKVAAGLGGAALVAAVWPWANMSPPGGAIALLAGQAAAAVLLVAILTGLAADIAGRRAAPGVPPQPGEGLSRVTLVHGLSMLLLVSLLFAYYVSYDLRVPYQNTWLPVLAGVIIGTGGIRAATVPGRNGSTITWKRVYPAWGLLFLPLLVWLTWIGKPAEAPAPSPASVRVMGYNLHNGFNTAGQLNIDVLAQVIQSQQPDIVLLQEVSRGWVVNGSLDSLGWLAHRLGMPYRHFTPASDALWGVAVLSRYPIVYARNYPLPPRNLPLNRSFAYLEIDIGQAEPLYLINTHFHHLEADSSIRQRQTETVLNFLGDRPLTRFVLAGDLNATPDTAEVKRLYQRGFVDVITGAGVSPDYTFPSTGPFKRLDYILTSADLNVTEVVLPRSTASDHLGIAATLTPD